MLVSIPHSGEKIPHLTPWLNHLTEPHLMRDVDRYVDSLYEPVIEKLKLKYVKTQWHRYAVDLNRVPTDVDCTTLQGSLNPAGQFNRGFHWKETTYKELLMPEPIDFRTHEELVKLIYNPFHQELQQRALEVRGTNQRSFLHLDLHSMPSTGTQEHRDPGEVRADIVISDSLGKSTHAYLRDLVFAAYLQAGFKVRYNWPYYGGRLTEQYGNPDLGHHCIQVELNRSLYMNEATKKKNSQFDKMQNQLSSAIEYIHQNLQRVLTHLK